MPDKKIHKKIHYKKTNLNDIMTYVDIKTLQKLDELIKKSDVSKIKKIIKELDKELDKVDN